MIVVDKNSRSPRYLINENAISFTENYQGVNKKGNPIYDVVAVSIVSNAAIMVYDENNGIGYGNDLQYQRWHLKGETTGLVSAEAHNIYARLSRGDKKEADIIFSVRNYNTDGSIVQENGEKTDPSDTYYYILIGTLTALTDANAAPTRTLTFDPGYLNSQKSNNEQSRGWMAEMFDLVVETEKLILAKLRFKDLSVKGEALFSSIASFFSGLKLGDNKPLVSVATGSDAKEEAEDAIATPAYVKAFSEARYLNKTTDTPQSVAGNVTFGRNVDITGNQHIKGAQEVIGLQTLHEGFITDNFSDVGGSISGAQLTRDGVLTAAGLISMSFNVFELVYNKIRATGSKLALNATATIERCRIIMVGGRELTPDEFYAEDNNSISNISYALITFKEDEMNGGLIPFENGDILYGYVNQIGDSGQHARGGQSAMHIVSSNDEIGDANAGNGYGKMTVRVQLYADAITDEQGANSVVGNMAPTESMTLAHRGNTHNTERQTSFFIDSTSGNIVMLQGINSPTIGVGNYAVVIGQCPAALYTRLEGKFTALKETDPVVYARYAFFENFIQIDHMGNPIQRENNRGEWSKPVTDSNGNQINPYTNDAQYYDTVTYQGSLYKCLKSNTTQEPSKGSDWLLLVAKGADGANGISYQLKPNYYSIQRRKDNSVTPTSLTFYGIKNDGGKQTDIKTSKNAIAYHLNGTEWANNQVLSFSGAEANNKSLDTTQFPERVTSIKFSWRINDVTVNTITIPFIEDGKDGADRVVANLFDNANFEKTVPDGNSTRLDAWGAYVTNSYPVKEKAFEGYNSYRVGEVESYILAQEINLGAKEYTISFCLRQDGNNKGWIGVKAESGAISVFEPKNSTSHTLDSTSTALYDKRYIISTEGVSSYEYFTFRLVLSKGSSVKILFGGSLTYYVFVCQPQIQEGSKATSFTKSQLELAGPAGEAGPAAYPMGVWNSSTTYKKTYNTVPFVYYDEDGKYYMLNADSAFGASQSPKYTEYWSVFTQFENLNVNVLMANWAKFGSKNGAVFYDKYLFSQDGIEGLTKTESSFGGYMDKMFTNYGTSSNPDYRLNGNFIPNLFIDFLHGALKVTRFSEPYISIKQSSDGKKYYAIDANANHNVKIGANVDTTATEFTQFTWKNNLILLPEFEDWIEDGQHFTILKEFGGADEGASMYNDSKYNNYDIVCCDTSILNVSSTLESPSYIGNWFIWKGLRTKFVMITSGMMLKLRTQIVGSTCYWYIENASDYSSINARFLITGDSYSGNIATKPSTSRTIEFKSNSENAYVNLTTDSKYYAPLVLAPYGRFSIVSGTNSREKFDVAISIGNVNGGNVAPIRTMHKNDYNW